MQKVFRYLEPFRRNSRMWRTDGRTDVDRLYNSTAALHYIARAKKLTQWIYGLVRYNYSILKIDETLSSIYCYRRESGKNTHQNCYKRMNTIDDWWKCDACSDGTANEAAVSVSPAKFVKARNVLQ